MKWALVYTTQARRDAKKVARSGLKPQAERLLEILAKDPYQAPPYERLLGDLAGGVFPADQYPASSRLPGPGRHQDRQDPPHVDAL